MQQHQVPYGVVQLLQLAATEVQLMVGHQYTAQPHCAFQHALAGDTCHANPPLKTQCFALAG